MSKGCLQSGAAAGYYCQTLICAPIIYKQLLYISCKQLLASQCI